MKKGRTRQKGQKERNRKKKSNAPFKEIWLVVESEHAVIVFHIIFI